jgi:serine protease Do
MTEGGHVLTNAHVVSPKATRIVVTLANLERVEAELTGWDHWTDLAVIRFDPEAAAEKGMTVRPATFGDSDGLKPGQTVFAVGTPNGLTRTVTRGIISNTNRFFEGVAGVRGYETGYFNNWLQTDAAINPGNSGGPLVDDSGAVIGINTRGYLGSNNLGFAIPSRVARQVMDGLIAEGDIERSYIGMTPGPLQDLESFFQLEANQGMLVNSVDPGSPAAEAGIRAGDVVLAIDDKRVDGRFPEQLPPIQNAIANRPIGSDLSLTVRRNGGEPRTVTLTTERLESRVGEEYVFDDWGISVEEISRTVAREEKLPTEDGVRVIGVQNAFPADKAGLRRGDIITRVNREALEGINQLKDVYTAFGEEPEEIFFEVNRNYRTAYIVLKP